MSNAVQIRGQLKRSKISVTSTCLKVEAKASTSFLICKCDEATQSLKILSKNNRQKKIKQNPMNCFENSYHSSSIKRAKEALLPTLPPPTPILAGGRDMMIQTFGSLLS